MIKMKYVGKSCMTINHGTEATLIQAKRISSDSQIQVKNFPSGLALAFRLENGNGFGWTDRKEWVRIKNK